MKTVSIAKIADFLGYKKVGRFYYSELYVNGYVGYAPPFGHEQVYLSDGIYADSEAYTAKDIRQQYKEYIKENPDDAL
jgi:hypothetical protein